MNFRYEGDDVITLGKFVADVKLLSRFATLASGFDLLKPTSFADLSVLEI